MDGFDFLINRIRLGHEYVVESFATIFAGILGSLWNKSHTAGPSSDDPI